MPGLTLAYPNGSGGGDDPNEQKVRTLSKKYSITARAVGSSPNKFNLLSWVQSLSPMIIITGWVLK